MHLRIPHKMPGKDRAVATIKTALMRHRAELSKHATINEETWEGDTLHFAIVLQGKKITGTLAVTETDFVLDVTLPLLWRMFEKRIEAEVESRVRDLM